MAFMKNLKLLHSLFPTWKTPYYSASLPTDDNPCRPSPRRHNCIPARIPPPEAQINPPRYGVALQVAGGVQFFNPPMERVVYDRDFSSGDLEPRVGRK